MTSRIASLLSLLVVACTTTPGAEGKVQATGSFDTVSFGGLSNALADVVTTTKGTALDIVLTKGARCEDVTDGPAKNAQFLELYLTTIPAGMTRSVAPTAPGTFTTDTASAGPYVEADVQAFDGGCQSITAGKMSGTVAITALAGGVVSGTFDLTATGSAVHATGSFACSGAGELSTPASTTSCH